MNRFELSEVARGDAPADLLIKNGKLVNVFSGEIQSAEIAIKGNRIAAVGGVEYAAGPQTEVIDAEGRYLCPGLIDGHIHVGGSQLSMTEFARAVVPHGTTLISTDFYEIGVVAGRKAIRFALDELKATPLKVLLNIPPHAYLGHGSLGNTNQVRTEDVLDMLGWPECTGLAEWNTVVAAIPVPGVRELTEAAWERKMLVGGHFGEVPPRLANATAALGVYSEHEAMSAEEALDRLRLGVHIQAREGSAGRDLRNVVKAITEHKADPRHFSFSTDEQEADSLVRDGHVDHKIRTAIRCGIAPITAVQMATINAAEYFRIGDDMGSIGPGKIADIVLVDDLAEFSVAQVIANGRLVARDGRYVGELAAPQYPDYFYDTIRLASMTVPGDFAVEAPMSSEGTAKVRVIGVNEGTLVTEERCLDLPVRDGRVQPDPYRDVMKIAVLDRHESSGRIGKAFVQGFRIKEGAIGSSFNPGQMNLMVAGTSDRDMSLVANRIAELGGGYVVARDGKILGELPLPLLGLFADEPCEKVVERLQGINEAIATELGTDFPGLHTSVAFVCLAVSIPTLKVCDRGLADVRLMEVVDLLV
jgi:adenine deaminase